MTPEKLGDVLFDWTGGLREMADVLNRNVTKGSFTYNVLDGNPKADESN